jgi:hypothetical protein
MASDAPWFCRPPIDLDQTIHFVIFNHIHSVTHNLPLEGSVASLADRRKTDRERQKRWRRRQQGQGKKQVSAMISLKAQLILNREKKRTGKSNSEIIEKAILKLTGQ